MHSSRIRRALCAAVVLGALGAAAPAMAQSNKVAAEALFEEGRRLMADGKYAEACPKFHDSYALDNAPGTLLNLGNCYEKAGQTASAWATFRDAIGLARAANRNDYVDTATRRAAALEPHLSRLTITVAAPVEGMVIKRDGTAVASAEVGTAIPVDPGKHTIEASAPGKNPWHNDIDVKPDGDAETLQIPALEDAPAPPQQPQSAQPAPSPAQPAPAPAPLASPPPDNTAHGSGSTQRVLGVVLGVVGVAGIGVGTGFFVASRSKYSDSLAFCRTANPDMCSQQGVDIRNDARSQGNIATVGVSVGLAALVAGTVLWFTAPSSNKSTGNASTLRVGVAPAPGGVTFQGAW
jgi:serine/threonine-protein kinase